MARVSTLSRYEMLLQEYERLDTKLYDLRLSYIFKNIFFVQISFASLLVKTLPYESYPVIPLTHFAYGVRNSW